MDWTQYDNLINVNDINEQIDNLPSGEFEELPDGKYEVAFDKAQLVPTKKDGHPMLAMEFTIIEGEFNNRKIYINQVLVMGDANDKYRVKSCNDLLRGLKSSVPVLFASVKNYNEIIDQISDECFDREYLLSKKSKQGKDGNSYANYSIIKAYE